MKTRKLYTLAVVALILFGVAAIVHKNRQAGPIPGVSETNGREFLDGVGDVTHVHASRSMTMAP